MTDEQAFVCWMRETSQLSNYFSWRNVSLQARWEDWKNKTTREPELKHWLKHDMHSEGTNFTACLFRLIRKSDSTNLYRLRKGFPDQCYCSLLWDHINANANDD